MAIIPKIHPAYDEMNPVKLTPSADKLMTLHFCEIGSESQVSGIVCSTYSKRNGGKIMNVGFDHVFETHTAT